MVDELLKRARQGGRLEREPVARARGEPALDEKGKP
jgi:hypothetical protein